MIEIKSRTPYNFSTMILWTMLAKKLQYLIDNNWVDRSTRAVIVEVLTFNPQQEVFVLCSLITEITAGGNFYPTHDFIPFSMKDFTLSSHRGRFIFVLDIFVLLSIGLFFIVLILDVIQNYRLATKWYESVTGWEIITLANIGILVTNYYYRMAAWHISLSIKDDFFGDNSDGVNKAGSEANFMFKTLVNFGTIYTTTYTLYSLNVLLCYCRLFQYLQHNSRLNVLTETVNLAMVQLFGVLVIFGILLLGWGFMGTVLYGIHMENYRTVFKSIGTLMRSLLGSIDEIDNMQRVAPTLTAPYLITFFAICWLVVLNMVLAVINDSFGDVQQAMRAPDWSLKAIWSDIKKNFNFGTNNRVRPRAITWDTSHPSNMPKSLGKYARYMQAFEYLRKTRQEFMSREEIKPHLTHWNDEQVALLFDKAKYEYTGEGNDGQKKAERALSEALQRLETTELMLKDLCILMEPIEFVEKQSRKIDPLLENANLIPDILNFKQPLTTIETATGVVPQLLQDNAKTTQENIKTMTLKTEGNLSILDESQRRLEQTSENLVEIVNKVREDLVAMARTVENQFDTSAHSLAVQMELLSELLGMYVERGRELNNSRADISRGNSSQTSYHYSPNHTRYTA